MVQKFCDSALSAIVEDGMVISNYIRITAQGLNNSMCCGIIN